MTRIVLDTSVFVSALISRGGPPDRLLRAWRRNRIEVVASERLLQELERVLARPKFADYITPAETAELVARVRRRATMLDDPAEITVHTRDPDDDYLVALAGRAQAILVTGDRDLLDAPLTEIIVLSPRQLVDRLGL